MGCQSRRGNTLVYFGSFTLARRLWCPTGKGGRSRQAELDEVSLVQFGTPQSRRGSAGKEVRLYPPDYLEFNLLYRHLQLQMTIISLMATMTCIIFNKMRAETEVLQILKQIRVLLLEVVASGNKNILSTSSLNLALLSNESRNLFQVFFPQKMIPIKLTSLSHEHETVDFCLRPVRYN